MSKVLIIDNSRYVTGALKSIAGFANALANRHEFTWALPTALSEADAQVAGIDRVHRFNFAELSRKPGQLVRYLPRLIANTRRIDRLVRDHGIDIVHVNDLYNMCGVALKLVNRRVKVVYHVRLLRNSYVGPFYERFLDLIERRADAIVCCSRAVSRDVGERRVRVEVIHDSQSFDDTPPPELRPEVGEIVYVGNFLPGKGHDLALEALAIVGQSLPDVKLRFVGRVDDSPISREFRRRLDGRIEELALNDNVIFDGFRTDIVAEMRRSDIVLNMSESESFSMVCLEALRSGVPLVASDCGGPAEIFEHMRSGWLVPNRDVVAAAEAIKTLAADPKMRRSVAVEGAKFASANFDVAKNAEKLEALYRRMLEIIKG
jgi:glycosyltransferase involved in cell wall biosynthesis